MKKSLLVLSIVGGLILVLWVTGRVTGALQYYKIPTPANEPSIKVGEHILASNLKKTVPGCFIVFTSAYEDSLNAVYMENYKPGTPYLHRLCAQQGNIIEMKNGVLYVDGKNFDKNLNLKNQYKISANEYAKVIEDEDKIENDSYRQIIDNEDSVLISLDNTLLKKYQPKIKLGLYIETNTGSGPFKWLNKNTVWTADNFGPLTIPPGCCFVLGDNRHNAMDSRYIGFIKTTDIKGVVLNK